MADYSDTDSGDTTETDPDMMEAMAAMDETSPKPLQPRIVEIKVIWEWLRRFERCEELWYFLRWTMRYGIKLPRIVQGLRLDPTVLHDTDELKDVIREMYNGTRLGLEIHRFMLTWKNHEGVMRYSCLPHGWEAAKDILLDPCNSKFAVYVVFQCVGDAGGELSSFLHGRMMDREREQRLGEGGW